MEIIVAAVWESWSRTDGQGPFWGAVRRCSAARTLNSLHKTFNNVIAMNISFMRYVFVPYTKIRGA